MMIQRRFSYNQRQTYRFQADKHRKSDKFTDVILIVGQDIWMSRPSSLQSVEMLSELLMTGV